MVVCIFMFRENVFMCDLHDLCQKVVEYRKKNDIYNMEKLIDEIEKSLN